MEARGVFGFSRHRGLYHGTNMPKIPDSTAKTITVAAMIGISGVTHIERINPRTAPAAAHMITLGVKVRSKSTIPPYLSGSCSDVLGSRLFESFCVMSNPLIRLARW
jgi:hypothetical protein